MKKAFAQRDSLKDEVRDLKAQQTAILEKLDAIGKQAPAAGQAAATTGASTSGTQAQGAAEPTGIEAQVKQLAEAVGGLVGDKQNEAKAQRRKAITDGVVAQANDASRELVRGALATLALDGAIDLAAEATQLEVDKALTKLRAANPGHFVATGNGAAAAAGAHDIIPPNTPLHRLTEEQLARLSDDDFKKISQASRTSGLVF